VLYRRPFEGRSARRYATDERPAFDDLDDRLLDRLAPQLERSRTLLDVGTGPATFARAAAARFSHLRVIAIDPSREVGRGGPRIASPGGTINVARAVGEALPLATASVDAAICLSSIRHVRDRAVTLGELRRVVRPGGRLVIVELDPTASAVRIAAHASRIPSAILRTAFGPLVVRTAPPVEAIEDLAVGAGWHRDELRDDPVQPVYILELV
jgi:ubiquinone/menaquinone biosynthesis C-methylase UbiE